MHQSMQGPGLHRFEKKSLFAFMSWESSYLVLYEPCRIISLSYPFFYISSFFLHEFILSFAQHNSSEP
jgi:hypothetical protein